MEINEMSNTFDVLYNNITSNQAPGLNEAEKSVLLTKAQNMLVKEYFSTRTDGVGGGFDGSQQRQYDFSSLIKVANLFEINTYDTRISDFDKLDRRSKVYLFPKDYFLAVNEILSDSKQQYSVLPLSYSEYQRLMLKPYNFPVKRGAWRLITNKINCNYIKTPATQSGDEPDNDLYYELLTTGCDASNRHLMLNIRQTKSENVINVSNSLRLSESEDEVEVTSNWIKFLTTYKGWTYWRTIYCENMNDGALHVSGNAYPIYLITLDCPDDAIEFDDYDTAELIKKGFKLAEWYLNKTDGLNHKWDTVEILKFTDAFSTFTAPAKTDLLNKEKLLEAEIIQLPIAEIIGKFTGDVKYQLRYVRSLKPIILDDLSNYGEDFTIDGLKKPTECELPAECHLEIVERAVTLAKIAWQGGTVTQAANASREKEL